MKLSIKETADLVTFFEQIPNGNVIVIVSKCNSNILCSNSICCKHKNHE